MATNGVPRLVVSNGSAPPPSAEDVASLTEKAFGAATSNASIEASYALCEILLSTVGVAGLQQYHILEDIRKATNDKKSGLRREGAQNVSKATYSS
jgi:elongation factor 3